MKSVLSAHSHVNRVDDWLIRVLQAIQNMDFVKPASIGCISNVLVAMIFMKKN